jgi:(heptosyl)LPS beta-1,4-glucosyltransferase
LVKLSVVVITKNEEKQIRACLRSVASLADELVVVDSLSTDATKEIARQMGATVFEEPFVSFARQRNRALDLAQGEWIFFVDADERATPELIQEIHAIVEGQNEAVGYWVPRRTFIFGHLVSHAGWSPDYQLRFFQRTKGHYREDRPVHELVVLQGSEDHLKNPLVHYNYAKPGQFLTKQRIYGRLEAERLQRSGVRPKPWNFVLQPWREFRRRYITLEGYRDGWLGLLLSLLLAWYTFTTYARLLRLARRPGV